MPWGSTCKKTASNESGTGFPCCEQGWHVAVPGDLGQVYINVVCAFTRGGCQDEEQNCSALTQTVWDLGKGQTLMVVFMRPDFGMSCGMGKWMA